MSAGKFRYNRCPSTFAGSWKLQADCSAAMLNSGDGRKHSGALGIARRQCLSTLAKGKQLATLVDAADPTIWRDVRLATGKAPKSPRRLLLWIMARALRDLARLCFAEVTIEQLAEIRERQKNSVVVVGSLDPSIGSDAAEDLADSVVKTKGAKGPTPRKLSKPGRSLRLVTSP